MQILNILRSQLTNPTILGLRLRLSIKRVIFLRLAVLLHLVSLEMVSKCKLVLDIFLVKC